MYEINGMEQSYLDEKLIMDIAAGDRNAFSELYRKTSDAVFGFSLSILRRQEDAEDVMHDAYIRIYTQASSYRPEGKPLAWILRIVRNLCYNRIRDSQREAGPPEEGTAGLQDQFDNIAEAEDRMVLEAAMRVLDQEEREIVILHAVSGYKHKEIAEMLDLPLNTVLSKYNRSLGKLKKEIGRGAAV